MLPEVKRIAATSSGALDASSRARIAASSNARSRPLSGATVAPDDRTFTDLEDLLLLDPIHDVAIGPDGFPVPRAG